MSVDTILDEMEALQKCGLSLLVGEKLGSGATRRVYAVNHNPDLVLKIEYAARKFCNVAEWDIWQTVRGHRNARWFAPVVSIDIWAGALIMKRTQPITEEEFYAEVKRLPAFFDDAHYANFGRIGDRIVCHDYGFHLLLEGVKSSATKPLRRRNDNS